MNSRRVRVERGLARHIREETTSIAIRVSGVPDVQRAVEVLESVRPYIHGLGVRFVNEAFPAPDGAMLWLDGKGIAVKQLLTIPDRVAQAFADAGLHDAVVGTARGVQDTDPDYPHELPACVSLTLLAAKPPPKTPAALPESWVTAGRDWWREQARDRQTWVSLVGRVYPVAPQTAEQIRQAVIVSRSDGHAFVAGSQLEGAASLAHEFSLAPWLILKLGGVPASELLATAQRFVHLSRDLASEAVYGVVEILSMFIPDLGDSHPVGRGLQYRGNVITSGDYRDHVFDAFPYQVLSEGHLTRLPSVPNAEPLAGGRVGLPLGRLDQWLPGQDLTALHEQGRALLEPCLQWPFRPRARPPRPRPLDS